MSNAATLEKRLAILEDKVARLTARMTPPQSRENWFELVAGSFKHEPQFDEVLRLGREIRQSDSNAPLE